MNQCKSGATIQVVIRYSYGNRLVEVVSDHADALKVLTGAKTLSSRHIDALKALGFEFVVVSDEEV